MGYFLRKFGLQPIAEAEADGENIGGGDDATDYTQDNTEQNQNNTTETTNQDDQIDNTDNADQDNNADQTDDNQDTTDYNDLDAANSENNDDNQDNNTAENDTDEGQKVTVDDLKKQEEDIYASANLSPEQLDIKHKELKQNYLKMYDITTNIIDRIGDASVNEDNIRVIEYISEELNKLRNMITDYVNSVYSGKSYIENAINFNRFLAVLNGINKMLEEIDKMGQ